MTDHHGALGAPDVLSLILEHAREHPGAPAAKDPSRELSYLALEAEVTELAAGMAASGVSPGDRVAIHIPNSIDFVVTALASLWVGAIFVPLAVTDPDARVASIVADCDPVLVVVNDGPVEREALPDRQSLSVAELRAAAGDHEVPERGTYGDAYCIYTSGTTGTPKGVVIDHQAFAVAVNISAQLLELHRGTRSLCVSPFHFDGSFGTVFPTLVAGGLLVIPTRESLLLPRVFFRYLAEERITNTGFSPSYLRLLLASPHLGRIATSPWKTLALGGEACSVADLVVLWEAKADLRIFNRYGPTETTIAVTHYEVSTDLATQGLPVPIGDPHPDTVFHLIDEQGGLIEEPERVGELYIGGPQLMTGYWGDPDLSAEVLRRDVVAGELLYRSGDLVRRDPGGHYFYVDRADRVIKRSGVRISLTEIADVLRNVPGVTGSVCMPFDQDGHLGIASFVVTAATTTPADLRMAARQHLPDNMLPDVLEIVDVFPLTSSSKVDERKLLADIGLREPQR